MRKTSVAAAGRAAGIAALTLAGAGCGAAGGSDGGSPQVATSFYPLQYVAERIAGGNAEVTNLTPPGVEPHDLELSVAQSAQIADADLVVYLAGFQPAVDEAVGQNAEGAVVEVGEIVDLQPAGIEEPADGEQPQGGQEDATEDPHFWLDPIRMVRAADAIRDLLSEADPGNLAAYERNFRRLREDLSALDREYATGLGRCRLDTVVVSHDAFGYLEKYGLEFAAVAGLSPDAEPSPRHVAALQQLIRQEGVTTVFSETLASPQMAETLATDLDLDTAVLDPVEGLSDTTAEEDYLSLMRDNLEALRRASRCR